MPLHSTTHTQDSHCQAVSPPPTPCYSSPPFPHQGITRRFAKYREVPYRRTDANSSCAFSFQVTAILHSQQYREHVTTDHPTAPPAPDRHHGCQPEYASNPSSSQSQARTFARPRRYPLALQRASHCHEQWQDLRPQQPVGL
jgi:hypothetical protein